MDQLSQVFRYVKILKSDNGRPTSVEICESFLGFYACVDQTAAGLSDQIVSIVQAKGLSFDKCRGQGYDGARTMSGVYNSVQKKIMAIQPKATYVHCTAHNLNLVVNDAINGVQEAQAFFTILQEIYVFWAQHPKMGLTVINYWGIRGHSEEAQSYPMGRSFGVCYGHEASLCRCNEVIDTPNSCQCQ